VVRADVFPPPSRDFVYYAKLRAPICYNQVASRTVLPYKEQCFSTIPEQRTRYLPAHSVSDASVGWSRMGRRGFVSRRLATAVGGTDSQAIEGSVQPSPSTNRRTKPTSCVREESETGEGRGLRSWEPRSRYPFVRADNGRFARCGPHGASHSIRALRAEGRSIRRPRSAPKKTPRPADPKTQLGICCLRSNLVAVPPVVWCTTATGKHSRA
jgi:hypothetical protein